ncbi:sulfatase [Nocardioides taihuensis]|uniref:Sulfatase n=1 Tax=Nocardioides taihuensis TaxID=1835606 RepID=A0ABW0BER9_9ACTN
MRHPSLWLSAVTSISSAALLVSVGAGTPALGQPVTDAAATAEIASVDQPNILIINLDDLRATGTLPAMPRVQSYFQQGGRTYTRSYATTPLCSPSRASLFTGRYGHNNGVTGNGLDAEIAALDQSAMFQGYLQAAGYNTAMAGKFMNTVPLSRSPRFWDRWAFTTGGYQNISYNVNGTVRRISGYYSDVLGNYAISDLNEFERQDAEPWLLYIAPQAPHSPSIPSSKYASAPVPAWTYPPSFNEADVSDKPSSVRWRGLLNTSSVEQTRTQHLRTIMSVNDLVGRVVDEISRLGEDGRTLAIFTSDNGYMWGEHRIVDKRFPYTESEAVPLLVRWPGHVTPGTVDNRLVSNVDIMPTLLEAAGVSPQLRYPLDGLSLFSPTPRTQLLIEYGRTLDAPLPPWASVLTTANQYTEWYTKDTGALTAREFYVFGSDPYQLVNLFRDGNAANDPSIAVWGPRLAALRGCVGVACVVTGAGRSAPGR